MASPLMGDDELDEFLDNVNASTLDADNSDLSSNLPNDDSIASDDDESSILLIDGKEYVETKDSAKFTLNPLRACMKSDLFEALEILRVWYL